MSGIDAIASRLIRRGSVIDEVHSFACRIYRKEDIPFGLFLPVGLVLLWGYRRHLTTSRYFFANIAFVFSVGDCLAVSSCALSDSVSSWDILLFAPRRSGCRNSSK
jgi:hypothetical protein